MIFASIIKLSYKKSDVKKQPMKDHFPAIKTGWACPSVPKVGAINRGDLGQSPDMHDTA